MTEAASFSFAMDWRQLRNGLWLTDSGPQSLSEVHELRRSLDELVHSIPGPFSILFDATVPIPELSVGVVRGYIEILGAHADRIRRVYVVSENALVRFAASSARLALKERLVVVASLDEALTHHEAGRSEQPTTRGGPIR